MYNIYITNANIIPVIFHLRQEEYSEMPSTSNTELTETKKAGVEAGFGGSGRYWIRTSDPLLVRQML